MTLSPFITFQDQGHFFIASTHPPFYTGEIIRSKVPPPGLYTVGVTGYDIFIVFRGALDGNHVLLDENLRHVISASTVAMANFYLTNRILPKLEKFRKLETIF